jgi:hypothetical protein
MDAGAESRSGNRIGSHTAILTANQYLIEQAKTMRDERTKTIIRR